MGSTAHGGLTYADLLAYPEDDGIKRELFDGELVVTPSPTRRHQGSKHGSWWRCLRGLR